MALNVLEIDPGRIWKGPWRWYHENMLDCCTSLQVTKERGTTMEQFVCLARCNSLTVKVKSGSEILSADDLRNEIKAVTRRDDVVFVAFYGRETMGQTGTGHFSPIAGYHEQQDLVLILDTARYKYPPHWVSLPVLLDAMRTKDPETGRIRGYMLLSSDRNQPSLLLFRPSCAFTVDTERSSMLLNFMKEWGKWLNSMITVPSRREDIIDNALDYMQQLQSQSDHSISLFCFMLPSMKTNNFRYAIACPSPNQGLTEVTCVVKSLMLELEALELFGLVQKYFRTRGETEQRVFSQLFQNVDYCPEPKCGTVTKPSFALHPSASCARCESTRMIEVGPEHAATLFLLAWPHSALSTCCSSSSLNRASMAYPGSQEHELQLNGEKICQAGTFLIDFITDDLDKCGNQCVRGEINAMKFKFKEVMKYHNLYMISTDS